MINNQNYIIKLVQFLTYITMAKQDKDKTENEFVDVSNIEEMQKEFMSTQEVKPKQKRFQKTQPK